MRTTRLHRASAVVLAMLVGLAGAIAAAPARAVELPIQELVWRYLDNGSDPAAGTSDPDAWAAVDFNDTTWKQASGTFGAKRGELASVSGYTPDNLLQQYRNGTTENNPAFFFRTNLTLTTEQLAGTEQVTLGFRYDDAVSVFVNGTYVGGGHDGNLAKDASRNTTYGGSNHDVPNLAEVTVDASLLHEGSNTIAARVNNGRSGSSDVYFGLESIELQDEVPASEKVSNVVLTLGTDNSERRLAFYTSIADSEGITVEVAPTASLADGNFPTGSEAQVSTNLSVIPLTNVHHVTFTGLQPDTAYTYRISNADGTLGSWEFSTLPTGAFEFFYIGDAQIGSSGNPARDGAGWQETLEVATAANPEIRMLVSGGDQVNTASSEQEYEYFTAPDEMKELALSPTIGNHDVGSLLTYGQHFNLANYDTGATHNHWYAMNDILFLHVNTDHRDYAQHRAWFDKVMAEQGDKYAQTIVVLHRGLYSTAGHSTSGATDGVRRGLLPIFDDHDIEIMLSGHDHSYARTHVLENYYPGTWNSTTKQWEGATGSVVSEGTPSEVTLERGQSIAIAANSSSGSKFYTPRQDYDPSASGYATFDYLATYNQERVPNYTVATADACSVRFVTHRSTDDSVVDDITVNTLRAKPTLTVPGAVTLRASEVEGFDALAGVVAEDRCEDVSATVNTDALKAEAGTYTLTYTVTDGYGHQVTAERTVTVEDDPEITVASAGTRMAGSVTNLWGTAEGLEGETVTAQALVDGQWVDAGESTVAEDGSYVVQLGDAVAEAGTYDLRVMIGENTSEQVTLTRLARSTSDASDYALVGRTHSVWGSVDGAATVMAQVWIPSVGWATSQTRTVTGGSYVIPLTYGQHQPGTYRWRVVVKHANGEVEYLAAFSQERLARPSATTAGVTGTTSRAHVWGTADGEAPRTVWTEVKLLDGRWARSQTGSTNAEGGYVLPLTYGFGSAGTHEFRVGTHYEGLGTLYSDTVTLTRR